MKLLRRFLWVLLLVVVIGAVVAATFPARYAYRFVRNRLGVVQLDGISGSIWQGHAGTLWVFSQDLGALDWHTDPLALLRGTVRARLALDGAALKASGIVERAVNGNVYLRDATFHMPASMAAPALDIPALNLLGDIDGNIVRARLANGRIDQASGRVLWRDAAVAGAAQAQFGDIEATFASKPDGAIVGVARDHGGPLKLDGRFRVANGQFDVDATLAARDGNAQVAEALRYVGQPQADGSSHLLIRGRLFALF